MQRKNVLEYVFDVAAPKHFDYTFSMFFGSKQNQTKSNIGRPNAKNHSKEKIFINAIEFMHKNE